jgi:hypothetical protein
MPFRRTEEVAELSKDLIQFSHLSEKCLCLKISRIKGCSILSKAFSKSIFKITISFLEWWQRWRNWNTHAK